jgi:acetyltransferase-like isoleucine patch superfamily enzyme
MIPLFLKPWFYPRLGRLLCKLTKLRNSTQIDMWKEALGSAHSTTILEYPLKIIHPEYIHIGPEVRISWGGWLFAMTEYFDQRFTPEIRIEAGAYIGNHVHIVAAGKIHIGRDTMLADNVFLSDNLHGYRDTSRSIKKNPNICCGEIHIADHCWIGENACIIGDVRIGRHCVVGANALVNRDLPPYSVAVGTPARIIKRYHASNRKWEKTHPDGRFVDDPDFDVPFEEAPSTTPELARSAPEEASQ